MISGQAVIANSSKLSLSIYIYVTIEELYLPDTRLHLHLVLRAGPALVGRVPVRAGGNNSIFRKYF